MTMSDPLGDMLTRIRNGQMARKSVISSPSSRMRSNVLEVLKREGYKRGFSKSDPQESKNSSELSIELKYYDLSIESRDNSDDRITIDAAEAIKKYSFNIRC